MILNPHTCTVVDLWQPLPPRVVMSLTGHKEYVHFYFTKQNSLIVQSVIKRLLILHNAVT